MVKVFFSCLTFPLESKRGSVNRCAAPIGATHAAIRNSATCIAVHSNVNTLKYKIERQC